MEEELKNIVEESLKSREDLFLVDVKISGKSELQKISILIDGDRGVGIDDCSMVSRYVSSQLDEKYLISEKYNLEVSSPGIDNPLKIRRQYHKNIGRKLKLILNDGKEIKGELIEVQDDSISINREVKIDKKTALEAMTVPLNNIKKAKVLISF